MIIPAVASLVKVVSFAHEALLVAVLVIVIFQTLCYYRTHESEALSFVEQ